MKQFPIITEIEPEVLHGAMNAHAQNIAIGFANYLHDYTPFVFDAFDAFDGPLKVYQKGGENYTIEQLYSKYISELLK
jgi:hypothetical protein